MKTTNHLKYMNTKIKIAILALVILASCIKDNPSELEIDSYCYDSGHNRYNVSVIFNNVMAGDKATAKYSLPSGSIIYSTAFTPVNGRNLVYLYTGESGPKGVIAVDIVKSNGMVYTKSKNVEGLPCK